MENTNIRADEISRVLKDQINQYSKKIEISETGSVLSVGDARTQNDAWDDRDGIVDRYPRAQARNELVPRPDAAVLGGMGLHP